MYYGCLANCLLYRVKFRIQLTFLIQYILLDTAPLLIHIRKPTKPPTATTPIAKSPLKLLKNIKSPILITEKGRLSKIENAQIIIYLLSYVLCSLQIECTFQYKRYTFLKMRKVTISFLKKVGLRCFQLSVLKKHRKRLSTPN